MMTERPQDPWVFRSVLDEKPRMVTMALNDRIWVAYSAQTGNLYKVWDGGVNFVGAVYDTEHGPQPQSTGNTWTINKSPKPWRLVQPDQEFTSPKVQYKGHYFSNEEVWINYELQFDDDIIIQISESPRVFQKDEQFGFERIFTISNLPKNSKLVLPLNFSSLASKDGIETNGELEKSNFTSERDSLSSSKGFCIRRRISPS